MSKLGSLSLASLIALGACGGDGGTTPPSLTTVEVTPGEAALTSVGATTQFSARGLNSAGAPVSGVSFEWSSSNSAVATVDGSGRATAMSVGEAFIRASSEGVTGQARLAVRECGAALQLTPGQWTALDVPTSTADCGFLLPAGNNGDTYRIAIVRTGSTPNDFDVPSVNLRVNPLGGSTAPPAFSPAPARQEPGPRIDVSRLTEGLRIMQSTGRLHERLREQEAVMVRALGGADALMPRFPEGAARGPARVDAPDRIMVDPATPSLCAPAGTLTPAFKVAENDLMVIYQDSAQAQVDSLTVPLEHAQRILAYYEAYGQSIIEDYFGTPTDIDGNGKIIVVVHPIVDGNTAAFVWSGDFFPRTTCAASNEAEIIFMGAGFVRLMDDGFDQALETAVHEAKHVVSLYKSVERGQGSEFHPAWVEEGGAEIAGNMSSRLAWATVGGPAANVQVSAADVVGSGFDDDGNPLPEFFGVLLRLFATQGYLSSQPNGVVVTPQGAGSGHSIYGSGWSFMRWLGDAYGNAGSAPFADADFFTQQVASASPAGIAGIEALTGATFSQLMVEFAAAIMLNGTDAPAPQRAITAYDFPSAVEVFCFAADNPPCQGSAAGPEGSYPWPVTTATTGVMWKPLNAASFQGRIGPAGIRVHEFRSDGTGGAEIVVEAGEGTRVVVARIL